MNTAPVAIQGTSNMQSIATTSQTAQGVSDNTQNQHMPAMQQVQQNQHIPVYPYNLQDYYQYASQVQPVQSTSNSVAGSSQSDKQIVQSIIESVQRESQLEMQNTQYAMKQQMQYSANSQIPSFNENVSNTSQESKDAKNTQRDIYNILEELKGLCGNNISNNATSYDNLNVKHGKKHVYSNTAMASDSVYNIDNQMQNTLSIYAQYDQVPSTSQTANTSIQSEKPDSPVPSTSQTLDTSIESEEPPIKKTKNVRYFPYCSK